ncbi:MAG: TonB-dependent receptor [Gammaproteobacteria bacterium]|nr:TonB-dependent receptor [Gammaproteobacteria bacterium]
MNLYGNVSRLYEPPTVFELADDVRASDQALDAMAGTVVEIGLRGNQTLARDGSWQWDASIYQAWIDDEILSVDDPLAPGTSLSTNVERTVHAGLEAMVGARLLLGSTGYPCPRAARQCQPQSIRVRQRRGLWQQRSAGGA